MSSEQILLVMTAVLAMVALVAAFVAVRAARHIEPAPEPAPPGDSLVPREAPAEPEKAPEETQMANIVEGRVIVAPTPRQVVEATMGRPLVRLSILSHGLAHALRPESRDRITALMRREFQSRRRQRKRAAKRAARLDTPQRAIDRGTVTTEAWLGELPKPQSESASQGTTTARRSAEP